MMELADCRAVYGDRYIRISGFDSSHGWESVRLSFIVNRPKEEPGFRLDRQEVDGPQHPLHHARLRRRPARRRALRSELEGPAIMAQPTLQAVPSARRGSDPAVDSIDLRREFEAVEIAPILAQLDRELIGLAR